MTKRLLDLEGIDVEPHKVQRLEPTAVFDSLPAELIAIILDYVPVNFWCALSGTCSRIRNIVHTQAKRYFRLYCGSQKIMQAPSFLPQLLGVCNAHRTFSIFQFDILDRDGFGCGLLPEHGCYNAQTSQILDGEDSPQFASVAVWKKAMSDGLSNVIIYQLIPTLKDLWGDNPSCFEACHYRDDNIVTFHFDDIDDIPEDVDFSIADDEDAIADNDNDNDDNDNDNDIDEDEDDNDYTNCVPYSLLSVLNISTHSTEHAMRLQSVAEGIIDTLLETMGTPFQPHKTKRLNIGHTVISFLCKPQQDQLVRTAFGQLLLLFNFCELLQKIIFHKPCIVPDIARAVSFVFDTFRRHNMIPLNFGLKNLGLTDYERIGCSLTVPEFAIVGACPDLMQLPFNPFMSDDILIGLTFTGGPNTRDPTHLICSPWFVMPEGLFAVQEVLENILSSDSLKSLKQFCSLLKPQMMQQLPWGKLLMTQARSCGNGMMTWLFTRMSIVTTYLPFHEWKDHTYMIRHLRGIHVNEMERKKFLTLYCPQNLK